MHRLRAVYIWPAVLHTVTASDRLNAIRERRSAIAAELARLTAEDDELLVQMGRLEAEAAVVLTDPYTVNAKWLIHKLGKSESSFWRLVRNKAKGFPEPIYMDSDPSWKWHEVKEWLDR